MGIRARIYNNGMTVTIVLLAVVVVLLGIGYSCRSTNKTVSHIQFTEAQAEQYMELLSKEARERITKLQNKPRVP